jgi:hypothetical protein
MLACLVQQAGKPSVSSNELRQKPTAILSKKTPEKRLKIYWNHKEQAKIKRSKKKMKMTEELKQHLINQARAGDESARIWLQEEVKSKKLASSDSNSRP